MPALVVAYRSLQAIAKASQKPIVFSNPRLPSLGRTHLLHQLQPHGLELEPE